MAEAVDVEEQRIISIYEKASPAVVHIASQVITMSFFWGPIPQEGTGSGFVIDQEGHIVTNNHVYSLRIRTYVFDWLAKVLFLW
jgi:S1-C subfamily serine protease